MTARRAPLFLVSFHGLGSDLGGCIMRADTQKKALKSVRKAGYAGQVGLPTNGRVLITQMRTATAAKVPERLIGKILTDQEFDEMYALLQSEARIPEGPALDRIADEMGARLDEDIAGSTGTTMTLNEAVAPHYTLLAVCWDMARRSIGDDDVLLVIDLEEVKSAKDPMDAVFAYARMGVVQGGGKVRFPLVHTGASQIPKDVVERIAVSPVREGYAHSFWVVAVNVGGRDEAGSCGCIRLSAPDSTEPVNPAHRPN